MYFEWIEKYQKIINNKNQDKICPMCGRKLGDYRKC